MYQPNRSSLAIGLAISLSLLTACSSEDKETTGDKATEAVKETVETITSPIGKVDVAEAAAPATEAVTAEATAPATKAVTPEAAAPTAEAVTTAAAAPAEQSAAKASGQDHAKGKEIFDGGCFVCHTTGVAGAPKLGDATEWAKRLEKGKDVLYTHAIKGFMDVGMMPPKGGNSALSDDDVKAAVDYMSAAQ